MRLAQLFSKKHASGSSRRRWARQDRRHKLERTLACEPLEERQLLSIAAMIANNPVYAVPTANGAPVQIAGQETDGGLSAVFGPLDIGYLSAAASPHPIIATDVHLQPTNGTATLSGVQASLALDGVQSGTVYYGGSGVNADDLYRFAVQVDAGSLATGAHDWAMTITQVYSDQSTLTDTCYGQKDIVNLTQSEYGIGWYPRSLDRLVAEPAGVALVRGDDNIYMCWDEGQGEYRTDPGDSGTLAGDWTNGFTFAYKDGSRESFDVSGLETSRTDPASNTTTYTYSGGELHQVTDRDGLSTTYTYSDGRLSQVTDFAGRASTLAYDTSGRLTSITQPDPGGSGGQSAPVTEFGYDSASRLTSTTDADNHTTSFAYDFAGTLHTITWPLTGSPTRTLSAVQVQALVDVGSGVGTSDDPASLKPTADNLQGTWMDELQHQTTFQVDQFGQWTSSTDALGQTTTWSRNDAGLMTSVTDPVGRVTRYAYDTAGRLTQTTLFAPDVIGPLSSPVTCYAYDAAGHMISMTDPLGNVTTYGYDSQGRQTSVTDPSSGVITYSYDTAGHVTSMTDPLGRVTAYQYDQDGNLTQVTLPDPDGSGPLTAPVTTYAYDSAGNMHSLTDPDGNTTTWTYDGLGRMTAETDPLSHSTLFVYDAVGNLIQETDRDGRVIQYVYDNLNRNTAELWKDGQTTVRTLTFTYDAAGHLTEATDPAATYTYSYDNLGRTTSVAASIAGLTPTVTLTDSYDAAGDRTGLAAQIGSTADFADQYTFDILGRMTQVEQSGQSGGNAVAPKRVDLAYDAASRFRTITRYANLAGTQLVAQSNYDDASGTTGYGNAAILTGLTYTKGQTTLAGYAWSYDIAGQLTQFDSTADGTANYSYDNTEQLTGATYSYQTNETYTYDPNGNRTNTGFSTGPANRLLSDGTYNYQYDNDGNRTKRTNIATGAVTEYTWDYRNRLVKVTERASAAGPATKVVQYTYDVFNRRVTKDVDQDDDGTFDSGERYVYDGNSPLPLKAGVGASADQIVLQFDGTSALAHRYLSGPLVDQVLADENASGVVRWLLADNEGTIRDVVQYNSGTDQTTVVDHLTYDAFGNITSESNSSAEPHFAYTGRDWDADVGLYYYRARWYDAKTGRYMSEDPSRFKAGDTNLNRYVWNRPTSLTDPTGLDGSGGGDSGGSGGDSGGSGGDSGGSGGDSGGSGGDSGGSGGDSGGSGGDSGGSGGDSGGSGGDSGGFDYQLYRMDLPWGLFAHAVSDTQIDLNWTDNSGGGSGGSFFIDRSTNCSTWTTIGSGDSEASGGSDTGLTPETTYYYELGNTYYEQPQFACIFLSNMARVATLPSTPTDLTVTSITGSEVNLSWEASPAEQDYYYIEQSVNEGDWQGVWSSPVGVNTATIEETVDPSVGYNFRVSVVSFTCGNSLPSEEATVTTDAWPAAPSGLTATAASSTEVDLTWTDHATDATAYAVESSPNGTTWTTLSTTLADDATWYHDTGLTEGTLYYYRVSATNTNGHSGYTHDAAITPLVAPTGLEVTAASGSEMDLEWENNSAVHPAYSVQQLVDDTWQEVAETDTDATCATLTGPFAPSTEYDFRVQAVSDWSESLPTDTVAVTTAAWPAAPTGLTATAVSATEIDLTWTDNATDATAYVVESSPDETATTWTTLSTTLADDATWYHDTGLTEGTLLYYRVSATNTDGASAYATASVSTPPAQPTGVEATVVSGHEILVQWNDNSAVETCYSVQQSIDDCTWQHVAITAADATSATVVGSFDPSTEYYFRVLTGTQTAWSLPSEVGSVTTPALPAAPTDLIATTPTEHEIDLAWTDNATDAIAYHVERSADGTAWTTVGTLAADATSYSDTGRYEGAVYFYRVSAANSYWDSDYALATVALPLAQPTGVQVTRASGSEIDLQWQWQGTLAAAHGYSVQQLIDGTWQEVATTAPTATSGAVNGAFAPTMEYDFRVQAVPSWSPYPSNPGESSPSETLAFTTPAWPVAPSNLTATAVSGTEIDLSWTASAGATAYAIVEKSDDPTTGGSNTATVPASQTSYAATGLDPTGGTSYSFAVVAVNQYGVSAFAELKGEKPVLPIGFKDYSPKVSMTVTSNIGGYDVRIRDAVGVWNPLGNVGPWGQPGFFDHSRSSGSQSAYHGEGGRIGLGTTVTLRGGNVCNTIEGSPLEKLYAIGPNSGAVVAQAKLPAGHKYRITWEWYVNASTDVTGSGSNTAGGTVIVEGPQGNNGTKFVNLQLNSNDPPVTLTDVTSTTTATASSSAFGDHVECTGQGDVTTTDVDGTGDWQLIALYNPTLMNTGTGTTTTVGAITVWYIDQIT